MRHPRERLMDILEAIERIERYAAKGRAGFEKDEVIQMGTGGRIGLRA